MHTDANVVVKLHIERSAADLTKLTQMLYTFFTYGTDASDHFTINRIVADRFPIDRNVVYHFSIDINVPMCQHHFTIDTDVAEQLTIDQML